ncbi:hypothetical protein RHCRD62_50393 [Rhodococcus sp. RD6.2]|nr:hypothetical protein RHCRD62_50393 [Rhodococcus sp. RD6.2]
MPALGATVPDVLSAKGFLRGAAANFGYMSGALKPAMGCPFRDAQCCHSLRMPISVLSSVETPESGPLNHAKDALCNALSPNQGERCRVHAC